MNLSQLTLEHTVELKRCKNILENPSYFIQLASMAGKPIDIAMKSFPIDLQSVIDKALYAAIETAAYSISEKEGKTILLDENFRHKVLATTSGLVGGSGGIATIAAELPITTTIIMRSILKIAKSHQFDIKTPEVKIACIEVFALGSPNSSSDDYAENSYIASRIAMGVEIKSAINYLSKLGTQKILFSEAPAIVAIINKIASHFGIVATNKLIAQTLPIVGGITAATINYLFISHYQSMADAHFSIKKLEKEYTTEVVFSTYKSL